MPSAALASSDDVSRKYSKMPFLRRQNGGISARSIGDEMPSAVCAAEGAMIRPLLSLPRLSRNVEARIQPGLSSNARSDGSRAIVPKRVHRAQKKATGAALLSQPVAILGVGAQPQTQRWTAAIAPSLDMKQFEFSIVKFYRLGSRMAIARLIKLNKGCRRSVSMHATCRRTLPHGGIRSLSKSAIRRNQHPQNSQKPTRSAS